MQKGQGCSWEARMTTHALGWNKAVNMRQSIYKVLHIQVIASWPNTELAFCPCSHTRNTNQKETSEHKLGLYVIL